MPQHSPVAHFWKLSTLISLIAGVTTGFAPSAVAGSASIPLKVSENPPYPASCNASLTGGTQSGSNFPGAEVEPWVAVNPRNTNRMAGAWQQDRWSNGGSSGQGTALSFNGGSDWFTVLNPPTFSRCTGGNAINNGNYERSTDPWLSFAPDGTLHQITLAFNDSNATNAVLASRSRDGGLTWDRPIPLRVDTAPTAFNDKESITADPYQPGNVYAIWDRLVTASENASVRAAENAVGYHGPTWFARSTDNGATWESARIILDPGTNNQTIGSQIVVLPSGRLVNVFCLIYNFQNQQQRRGYNVAVQYSDDKGRTWSNPIIIKNFVPGEVSDPATGAAVRTGDIIPDIAVGPGGTLYVVWQEQNSSGISTIAIARSTDGGLTWTNLGLVNRNSGGAHAFTASVEVAANGTVGVTYYDFRNNTSDPSRLETDYWFAASSNVGTAASSNNVTWAETRVTPRSFDMDNAPIARGYFVGDYQGLVTVRNTFRAFFVQAESVPNTTNVYYSSITP